MRLRRLLIRGFQQFRALDLDFTDPATGEPLRRVCFIGPNGSGKTTLLRQLRDTLVRPAHPKSGERPWTGARMVVERSTVSGAELALFGPQPGPILDASVTDAPRWREFLDGAPLAPTNEFRSFLRNPEPLQGGRDLVIEAPADASPMLPKDPPDVTLGQTSPAHLAQMHNTVGPQQADEFWKILMAQIAKREEQFRAFIAQPENRQRTVAEVEAEFDRAHPEVLPRLAELWNPILERAGLELAVDDVKLPSQLGDRLEARVRVKATGQPLPYNQLSSGFREFLFRLGYIRALYFGREVRHGFAFIDEPENSLHPDLLYDLVDVHYELGENTQLFMATHSPIVAAQFRPEERVLLDFDENGFVIAERGHAPTGDDPNDVLRKDFQVKSIYGRKGLEKWRRFVELRSLIEREMDVSKQKELAREYLEIGHAYGFDPDEVPAEAR